MALTRSQLVAGNSSQGIVLPSQPQGVIAGPGLTIDSNGVIQINSQTVTGVMKLGQNATTAAAAFNGYTWPVAGGSAGQQLTTNATGVLAWSDPDGIPWTAKGEIVVATGANAQTLLTVGSDGQILVANSSTFSGLSYTSNYVPTAGATTAAFLPAGVTSSRPSLSPSQAGAIRFNTSTVELEFWSGTSWVTASTDGTVTNVTGTAPISVATGTTTPVISLDNTAVVPGTYTAANITVDAQGRITAAANGPGGGGTVTYVDCNGGSTGLTFSGGPVTTSGFFTMGGTLGIANGGTGATTATAAINALLPPQAGQGGNFLKTDGSTVSWVAESGSGTVTNVTGTLPITVATGTTTPVIAINAATTAATGSVQLAASTDSAAGTSATLVSTPAFSVPKDASGMAGAALIPGGISTARPGTPSGGMFRYNTTLNPDTMEFYDSTQSSWIALATLPQLQGVALDAYSNFSGGSTGFTDIPIGPGFAVRNTVVVPAGYTNFIAYSSVAFAADYDTTVSTVSAFSDLQQNGIGIAYQAVVFGDSANLRSTQVGASAFQGSTSAIGVSNTFTQAVFKTGPAPGAVSAVDSSLVVFAWTI